jgi:hypothetical protein
MALRGAMLESQGVDAHGPGLAGPSAGATATSSHFPVPGYLTASVRAVVPWARRHVARVAARYQASLDDLWDETIAALVRASVSYVPSTGAFGPYARTAIHRACARAVNVGQRRRRFRLWTVALEDAGEHQELTGASLAIIRPPPSAQQSASALQADD